MANTLPPPPPPVPFRPREYGQWSEVISSGGRIYYYNKVTEQSQWVKPEGWEKAEVIIFPVLERLRQEELAAKTTDLGEDMDVSSGSSPSSSSPPESRPASSKENKEERKEEKSETSSPTDQFYREDLIVGMDERFMTKEQTESDHLRASCTFHLKYASQRAEMFRARSMTRNSMLEATTFQKEAAALDSIRQEVEQKHKETRGTLPGLFGSKLAQPVVKSPENETRLDSEPPEKKKRL